jgi:murein DD-endopeptidase MepM/ murein hydrolase activator NlpD
MDVRKPPDFLRGLILALVIPAFLAGCTSSPRTSFDWGVDTRFHHEAYVHRTYVAARKDCTTRDTTNYQYTSVPGIVPRPRPEPGWYQAGAHPAPHDPAIDVQPANGDTQFAWPIHGRVISNFGATIGGERNDGINIAAANGDPIRAAADGTVSYTGNDLKSYGNLVLIRHGDDYVTAYAHAERIAVNRGDHVVKGQVIAYAGNTGDVDEPQLHFEIRRGVRPVDPRPLLRPLVVASR